MLFRSLQIAALGAASIIIGFSELAGEGITAFLADHLGKEKTITLGLVLILRGSWKAKRLFIRAQYARPKWVYPFRRLMRKRPEFAPVFWQQALRAEKLVLRRANRPLKGWRKRLRRTPRKPAFA